MLVNYENDILTLNCEICGQTTNYQINKNFTSTFIKEFGQYENLNVSCAGCQTQGRNITHVINLNIPEFEEAETENDIPAEEKESRNIVRKIMWSKREDLKKRNQENERQKFLKKQKRNEA